jgi:hypothetical protein
VTGKPVDRKDTEIVDLLPPLGEGKAAELIGRVPGGAQLGPLARVVVALVVLGMLVVAALLTDPWGFIVLGSAVGVLVVAGIPAALAGLRPVAALASAALPLFVPVLVFAAAGVVKSPIELQFAVGLATLLAAVWLVKPEAKRIGRALKRQRRWRKAARSVAQVGVPILVVVVALAFLAGSLVQLVGDGQAASRTFFVLAVGSLAAAAVCRVVGYATKVFPTLVAVALLLLLARLAMEIGLLAEKTALADVPASDLALLAGAMLGAAALAEIVATLLVRGAGEQGVVNPGDLPLTIRISAWLETPWVARWFVDRVAVAGLGLSILSAALLLGSVLSASYAGGAEEGLGKTAQPGEPPADLGTMSDAELAETFSPVLLFTEDQRWTPIPVDEYVVGATVEDWEGRETQAGGVSDLETDCPGVVKSPCYVLTQSCAGEPDECAEDLPDDNKAVYVRVAHRSDWADCVRAEPCADGSPNPFGAAKGDHAQATETLIQYWYFYPYNEWVAPVAIGELKETHAADWEAVTIGLSDEEPLWVAYSAHCGGTFADWDRVRVYEGDPRRLRPLVAVAHGSQANYRAAEESRVPNFAECSGIPKDRLTLVSYAANIRDRTDDAKVWNPAAGDLRPVTARDEPMSFPGRWAPHARMRLENLRVAKRLGGDSPGPATPSLQALWQTPMQTIFGSGAWKED